VRERKKDAMLHHPADGIQWRNFDLKHKDFAVEVRNIRFGLSIDGINPFGEAGSSHSTWPVTLCIYSLPSWLCMKRKFIMMPLLISGPVRVSNDIDVYLQQLIDDLLVLCEKEGVRKWDEFQQQYFNLRAMLFITIQDVPALGSISGQEFKGYKGCTWCMDETGGIWLKHCKKVVYMGHCRFLRADHAYRKNKKAIDRTIEKCRAPKIQSGEHMFRMVKDLNVVLGKGKGGNKKTKKAGKNAENNGNETLGLFKKRSIFWNLPYWKDLMVCHAIDVIHMEKNVCKALVGTLLDMPGKIKDKLNARMDLEEMKLGKYVHHETLENWSKKFPTACYTLSKHEKMSLCNCLYGIKVLTGYSDNVSGMVNMKTL
jgi:hypothetical protein